MSRQQHKSQASSLCKTIGHEWLTTTDNYRRCTRASCRYAERLVDGTWVEVTTVKCSKRKASSAPAYQPILPFDEQALLREGIHPDQKARERRAIAQYYQTVGQR